MIVRGETEKKREKEGECFIQQGHDHIKGNSQTLIYALCRKT